MDPIKLRHWSHRLGDEFDHICYTYRKRLRRPVIRVVEMASRWAHWDPELRTLSLSLTLIKEQPWEVVVEVMKHEMAHQIVSEEFGADEGHGPLFLRACQQLGLAEWATRASVELGELPPNWRERRQGSAEERLLLRVEKLLQLANSSNEFEAIAAMKKVQELYLKYHIERHHTSQHVYLPLRLKRKRVERHVSAIATLLQDFFRVEVIHTVEYDAEEMSDFKVIELLGRKEDVLLAEYAFHFLINQLRLLWKSHGQARERRKQNSFYLGVLAGFREKLESNQKELCAHDKSMALMVSERDLDLEDYLEFRYPRLVRITHGRIQRDGGAFERGREHGRNLVFRKGLDSASERSGRLLRGGV